MHSDDAAAAKPPMPCLGAFVAKVAGEFDTHLSGHAIFDFGDDGTPDGSRAVRIVLEHTASESSGRHQLAFITKSESLPKPGAYPFRGQSVWRGFVGLYAIETAGARSGQYFVETGTLHLDRVTLDEICGEFQLQADGINTFDLFAVTGSKVKLRGTFVAKRHSDTFAISDPQRPYEED